MKRTGWIFAVLAIAVAIAWIVWLRTSARAGREILRPAIERKLDEKR